MHADPTNRHADDACTPFRCRPRVARDADPVRYTESSRRSQYELVELATANFPFGLKALPCRLPKSPGLAASLAVASVAPLEVFVELHQQDAAVISVRVYTGRCQRASIRRACVLKPPLRRVCRDMTSSTRGDTLHFHFSKQRQSSCVASWFSSTLTNITGSASVHRCGGGKLPHRSSDAKRCSMDGALRHS